MTNFSGSDLSKWCRLCFLEETLLAWTLINQFLLFPRRIILDSEKSDLPPWQFIEFGYTYWWNKNYSFYWSRKCWYKVSHTLPIYSHKFIVRSAEKHRYNNRCVSVLTSIRRYATINLENRNKNIVGCLYWFQQRSIGLSF